MSLSACSLQNAALLLPSTLKYGFFVQESYEQQLLRMFTMLSSACCLPYTVELQPSTLEDAYLVQESREQRHRRPDARRYDLQQSWSMFATLSLGKKRYWRRRSGLLKNVSSPKFKSLYRTIQYAQNDAVVITKTQRVKRKQNIGILWRCLRYYLRGKHRAERMSSKTLTVRYRNETCLRRLSLWPLERMRRQRTTYCL